MNNRGRNGRDNHEYRVGAMLENMKGLLLQYVRNQPPIGLFPVCSMLYHLPTRGRRVT